MKRDITNKTWLISLAAAFVYTQFLFFIDEGAYNFNWMKSLGNYFALMIYLTGMMTAQVLCIHFLFPAEQSKSSILVKSLIGLVPGVLFCVVIIYLMKWTLNFGF